MAVSIDPISSPTTSPLNVRVGYNTLTILKDPKDQPPPPPMFKVVCKIYQANTTTEAAGDERDPPTLPSGTVLFSFILKPGTYDVYACLKKIVTGMPTTCAGEATMEDIVITA